MTFALVVRYWREAAIAVLALALAGSCVARDRRLVATGVATERSRQADSLLQVTVPLRWKADTLYVHDTLRVARRLATFDTVRDTVLRHITDTLVVRQFVAAADSFKAACTDALSECNRLRGLLMLERDAWKAKAETRPLVIGHSCLTPSIVAGVAGIVGGYVLHRR
jgi:hypothetical protein